MNDRSCRRRCRSSGTSGCATPSRFLAALDSAHWGYRRSAASGGHWEVGDYVFPGATTEPTDGDAAVELQSVSNRATMLQSVSNRATMLQSVSTEPTDGDAAVERGGPLPLVRAGIALHADGLVIPPHDVYGSDGEPLSPESARGVWWHAMSDAEWRWALRERARIADAAHPSPAGSELDRTRSRSPVRDVAPVIPQIYDESFLMKGCPRCHSSCGFRTFAHTCHNKLYFCVECQPWVTPLDPQGKNELPAYHPGFDLHRAGDVHQALPGCVASSWGVVPRGGGERVSCKGSYSDGLGAFPTPPDTPLQLGGSPEPSSHR